MVPWTSSPVRKGKRFVIRLLRGFPAARVVSKNASRPKEQASSFGALEGAYS